MVDGRMIAFRILFVLNALVILVLAFFFVTGLQNGESTDSMSIWLPILAVPIVGAVAAWILRAKGRNGPAVTLLLAITLLPVAFIAFYGILFATGASWQ